MQISQSNNQQSFGLNCLKIYPSVNGFMKEMTKNCSIKSFIRAAKDAVNNLSMDRKRIPYIEEKPYIDEKTLEHIVGGLVGVI